jgi:hypothetical protein
MSQPEKKMEEEGFVPPKAPEKPEPAETGYVPPRPPKPPTKPPDEEN